MAGQGLNSRTARRLGNKSVSITVYQPLVNHVEVGDLILLMIVRQPVQFVITAVARVTRARSVYRPSRNSNQTGPSLRLEKRAGIRHLEEIK